MDWWRNQRRSKKYLETNANTIYKSYGIQQNRYEKEVRNNKCLQEEKRKISNEQPDFTPHGTKKEEQTTSKVNRRRERLGQK